MENNSENTRSGVRLELGDIEMGLDDALTLRKGMEIKCELPEEFEAALSYNGAHYAKVSVCMDGSNMKIKIL